ncbi:flagellar hook-length control protein FliK [Paramagnetospirillum kuznetsovii]|uniref:Flagellar hook-length control protein FliK n=1 Tax=Paramagnetospirillum kuznetsovii TaxID=2053833 RepID=A0A364NX40_9PROT|nr:flagellar hook-length control protein FliK [Paramagnetospirillum kuznetsovii]RAU21632.1 flagellar hook-length control protein FliK [Paramagnetospirillum kuznetsovii]
MTVQTIDKRLATEANMTPATSDKQQSAISVEDAFVALLQQTAQRFGNKAAGSASPDKVMNQILTQKQVEIHAEKAQAARGDAKSDHGTTGKDGRQVVKADKPRQSDGGAPTAKVAVKDDDAVAPVATDDTKTVAADDDAPKADTGTSDNQNTGQNDTKAEAQQVQVNAVAAQEKVVVEIDITVTETVEVVEVNPAAQAVQADNSGKPVQQAAAQADTTGKDPLAGLSKDDRQRINDLEKRIVDDLDSGDADDALDAATELVDQLISKATQQQNSAVKGNTHDMGKANSLKDQQAEDLAAMLAGSGAQMDVQVQVTETVTETVTQTTASALDVLAQMTTEVQNPTAIGQGQTQGQQQNTNLADTAVSLQPAVSNAAPTDQVADDFRAFSAVLAAQVEASTQEVNTTSEQRPNTTIAAVGPTQAADKPSATQAAAPTARAPRVPLQQQVMEQVSVQIDKAVKDGADTVKIQLRPYDLGRIEIKLEVIDGHVSASVTAEKPETLALLQKDAKGLEKALEDAGLKPDASATSFSLKNGEQQNNADRGHNNQRRGRGRGTGQAEETAAIGASQAAQPRRSGGRSGVDISV